MSEKPRSSKKFETQYKQLNPKQKEAVDTVEGPVLVVAGPGSGKTQVITMRTANILKQTDANPGNILCLTFTESAAMNMKQRLAGMIGKDAYGVAIETFHSFGVDVISRYPEFFYGGASFYPADELVTLEVIEEILGALRYDDPLSSTHPKEGYVYLKDVQQSIKQLKQAGLNAEEFEKIVCHNEKVLDGLDPAICEVFEKRMTKKSIPKARALCGKLQVLKAREEPFPVPYFESLSSALLKSLERAVEEAEALDSQKPLSAWKKEHTKKNEKKALVLKETATLERMHSLVRVYKAYRVRMYELGYYDFEDMLLEVIQTLRERPELQHELWEQYQYVMVDEFQDTNDAQMRLIYLLTEAEVTEGRPNICAVGDDDQAIYKFQGALLSNILDFRKRYKDPKLVVLTENYRSTQDILNLAQFFIKKGEERLETVIPELEKTLVASNKSLGAGDIVAKEFQTNLEEYSWVAGEIQRLIDNGESPRDIAVISRKHKGLEAFSKYMSAYAIPTFYERNQNVFDQPHVRQLVQMARFVGSLLRKNTDEADELLPEILSFPFWRLSKKTLWNIATTAERGSYARKKWMDVMMSHEDKKVREIAEFFLEVAHFSRTHTLLETLDLLIGEHVAFTEGSDEDEKEGSKKKKKSKIKSPFKSFYFNEKVFDERRVEYLTFLSSLNVFVSAIREYRHGVPLSIDDLVSFVDRHENFGIRVIDKSPFAGSDEAVTLLTAHKAKGLEYGTVFILSCQEDLWAGKGFPNKLKFPGNLPIEPAGENADDHLRLFFVALTRAKERLYMTSYRQKDTGKPSAKLRFFDVDEETGEEGVVFEESKAVEKKNSEDSSLSEALYDHWRASHAGVFVPDEEAMLRKLLENYQMSATHLNNFLNVPEGGPRYFLEQSLLHFPQAKNPNMSYGTAMHKAIEELYTYLRMEGTLPGEARFLESFENALLKERLSEKEYEKWLVQGKEALSAYFKEKKDTFERGHMIETNFKREGVVIGESEDTRAHLSGKIDKMVFWGNEALVVDYKTGKAANTWKGGSDIDKQKLFRYENQLYFYKLLVENSEKFGAYKVKTGVLEYLEPRKKDGSFVELPLELSDETADELSRLIEIVYTKIQNLDFPDTSAYSKDLKGILAFKSDLLEGKI